MKCPTCHSENVQKLKVVYEAGTQNTVGRSHTVGGGYGAGGFGATATTTTRAQTQSIAARNVAPPSKKSYLTTIVLLLVGFLILKYMDGMGLPGIALLGLGGWLGYRAYIYNKDEWPGAYNTWSKSWQCNKCGNIYVD